MLLESKTKRKHILGRGSQYTPSLIAEVPTVIMAVTAVEEENTAPSSTKELPFITHHTTVCTNKGAINPTDTHVQ